MYRLVRHTNICTCGFTIVCTLTYVQVGKAHKYIPRSRNPTNNSLRLKISFLIFLFLKETNFTL